MSIFRIYPDKSNTIASGVYKNYNAGQNAVAELWYGGGGTDTAPEKRNSISRFLVKFDLSELINKINNKEINQNKISSFRLKMKNSIPRDKVLEPEFEFDRLNKSIATSFDLIVFQINKDWDEGRGYDLFKENYLVKQKGNLLLTGYSNWEFAKNLSAWTESGVYNNPATGSTFTSTQHFDLGDEDVDMDITNIVNDWLSGGTENNGLGVAFTRSFELLSTDTRYIASFFTEKTNTSFKPYIEVIYNQTIKDDRDHVANNRTSRLFLYTYSGHSSVNYFSASTVDIQTATGVNYLTGVTPTHLSKGVYYIDVLMTGTTKGQRYKDVWRSVTFEPGIDQQDFTQTFIIKDNFYTANKPHINDYALTVYGLEPNKVVYNEEIIKVFCDLRVNYSNNTPSTPYNLKYRMVMNNQLETIPWTSVHQTVRDNCQENYFDLDTAWLLHNQTYELQFMIEEMGSKRILPEKINFKVQRPF